MGWISQFFTKPKDFDAPSPSTGFHDIDGQPVALSVAAADVRAARELVHNTAVNTALAYGIPARWLAFEVVTIADDEKAYFQLQIILRQWDEYLLAHAYAFEMAVTKKIREEDVNVGRAVRAVLWRVASDAGCPYDEMPKPESWTAPAIAVRAKLRERITAESHASASAGELRADAAAVRSTMPAQPGDYLLEDTGFDATRPSSFGGFSATEPFDPAKMGRKN